LAQAVVPRKQVQLAAPPCLPVDPAMAQVSLLRLLHSFRLLAAAYLLRALGVAADNPSDITELCQDLLRQVDSNGHSRFELGALCRSRLPPRACRMMLAPLDAAQQPWSSERISDTCMAWDVEWKAQTSDLSHAGRTERAKELKAALDVALAGKRKLGICDHLALDECVKDKAQRYDGHTASSTRKVDQIIVDTFINQADGVTAASTGGVAPTALPDNMAQVPPFVLKYEEWRSSLVGIVGGSKPIGIWVGVAMLTVPLVAAVAFARRARRGAYRSVQALSGDDEQSAEALETTGESLARMPVESSDTIWSPFCEQGILAGCQQ